VQEETIGTFIPFHRLPLLLGFGADI